MKRMWTIFKIVTKGLNVGCRSLYIRFNSLSSLFTLIFVNVPDQFCRTELIKQVIQKFHSEERNEEINEIYKVYYEFIFSIKRCESNFFDLF